MSMKASMKHPGPIDFSLVAGFGLLAGSLVVVAHLPAGAAIVVLLALVVARAARRGKVAVLATVAVAVAATALGAARAAATIARDAVARDAADLALPRPARCSARARVDSSPVEVRGVLRWDATLRDLECEGRAGDWSGLATLYGGPSDLARGDEADVVASLAAPERFWNLSEGDPRPRLARRGVMRTGSTFDVHVVRRGRGFLALVDRARARVRARIDAAFQPDLGAMARALVLGESDLAADDDRAFRASGLSHLLAVSGMHLVLVLAALTRSVEATLVRFERVAARTDVGRGVALLGVAAAWIYAELAGAGGSTLRAAWMATAFLAARAAGRRTDAVRAFGLSVVVMALADPLVAFDLSFALSAAATGGLLAFGAPLAAVLEGRAPWLHAHVARAAATTLAATIPCVPLVARIAPTLPLAGVVANLVAVPIGECAALPLCLLHAALAWWPASERGCAAAASGALLVVRAIARAASATWTTVQVPQPTAWELALSGVALGAAAMRATSRAGPTAIAAGFVALEVIARRAGAPHGVLRATFLDVGQGDSAIVDLPDGEAMVIDGGGFVGSPIDTGDRVLAPELRARRRGAVALAVLSHPHPDHFGGLLTGLAGVRLGAFWDTGQGEREGTGGGYAALLAALRARGVPVLRPGAICGRHLLGGATIEVLDPCPDFTSDRGPNDNSIVLRVAYGSRAILFVGDAEHDEEGALLAKARDRLRADVLKVGHHGSRTSSTPEFVAAVAPHDAIISAGRRNRFGHPSPMTLATLSAAGARAWRTDRDGAVEVVTDGTSLEVRALAGGPEDAALTGRSDVP
jgi:competence protein ComEC